MRLARTAVILVSGIVSILACSDDGAAPTTAPDDVAPTAWEPLAANASLGDQHVLASLPTPEGLLIVSTSLFSVTDTEGELVRQTTIPDLVSGRATPVLEPEFFVYPTRSREDVASDGLTVRSTDEIPYAHDLLLSEIDGELTERAHFVADDLQSPLVGVVGHHVLVHVQDLVLTPRLPRRHLLYLLEVTEDGLRVVWRMNSPTTNPLRVFGFEAGFIASSNRMTYRIDLEGVAEPMWDRAVRDLLRDGPRLLAGVLGFSGQGVFSSTDGGGSWSQISFVAGLELLRIGGRVVIVGSSFEWIDEQTGSGRTIDADGIGGPVHAAHVLGDRVYVVSDRALFSKSVGSLFVESD